MNYGDLLYRAHENKCSVSNKQVRCYKTSFSPHTKPSKSKVSSDNIKKYLTRKQEEEKKKIQAEERKKKELFALRSQDRKAQQRVHFMLKRTKSANKSVMEDAVDNVNTAVTLMGRNQCDVDDYGYVSQEASTFYNKLMNKYENMAPVPAQSCNKKKEIKDLDAAKERVKLALQKDAEDEELPYKWRRRWWRKVPVTDFIHDSVNEKEPAVLSSRNTSQKPKYRWFPKKYSSSSKKESTESKTPNKKESTDSSTAPKKPKSTAPPPPNFNELLKIAMEKQHEPINIAKSARQKEPQRLMTSKEKEEFLRKEEMKRKRVTKERIRFNKLKEPDGKVKDKKEGSKKREPSLLKKIPKLSESKTKEEPPGVDKQQTLSTDPIKSEKNAMEVVSKSFDKKTDNEEDVPKSKVNIKNLEMELSDIDKEIELLRKKKLLLALKAEEEQAAPVLSAVKPRPVSPKEVPKEKRVPRSLMKKKTINRRRIESDSESDSD